MKLAAIFDKIREYVEEATRPSDPTLFAQWWYDTMVSNSQGKEFREQLYCAAMRSLPVPCTPKLTKSAEVPSLRFPTANRYADIHYDYPE